MSKHTSTTSFQPQILSTFRSRPTTFTSTPQYQLRAFSISIKRREKEDFAKQAKALNQKSLDEHEDGYNKQIDNAIGEAEELQARTPWHREGSDSPPVKRNRSAGAMTKGIFLFSLSSPQNITLSP